MEIGTFNCSICGDESSEICTYCTKDACGNHLCERCQRCSDCCLCDMPITRSAKPAQDAADLKRTSNGAAGENSSVPDGTYTLADHQLMENPIVTPNGGGPFLVR